MPSPGHVAIAEQLARFGAEALLVTVDAEGRPHTAPVLARWADDRIAVTAAGARSCDNTANRAFASLVWAPTPTSDGYHLIVDGPAGVVGEAVEIEPTKVVLHQRPTAARPADPGSACQADCMVVHRA